MTAAQAPAASSPKKTLKSLVKQTRALPSAAAGKKDRGKLTRAAVQASKAAQKKPCSAVSDLERYRRVLNGVPVKKGEGSRKAADRLARLGPLSVKASQKLLADKRTKRCGGGVRPSKLDEVKTTVLQSDENGLSVRVQLPVLNFVPETGGGQAWTRLASPNTDAPGEPGTPGIPVLSNSFAVPDGAALEVTTGKVTSYEVGGVDVFPAQPDPVDGLTPPPDFDAGPFKTPPFQIDKAAYNQKGQVPARPADGLIAGGSRDLTVGNVVVPAVQYEPKSKELEVLKSVDVNISFVGGPHTFSEEIGLPWERPQQRLFSTFLNSNLLKLGQRYIPRRCGEEMLVITNPATRSAADTFAAAKRAQGMRTSVFDTGGAVGTTATEIQTFIRSRLTSFLCIHPSYVTIIGDDELVPTFPGINGIPSDLQYSMKNDTDELPDVAVGRILGNDLTQLNNAISKIVNYETTPLSGPILNRAMIAAQFQDDNLDGRENRTFIQFAETVRNGLVDRGVAVDRIYDDSPTATPLKFNDGTDLPAALQKPTFAWDGDGADVSAAWNEGRFLVIHRDHGWSDGWGHPGYSTTNVQALTNGAGLPVVMSINCSSAAYDYDETSFVQEALVKPDGGTVGAFGDTRDSPTWHNTQIGLGFVDGLLPSVLASEGPALKQRVGDALINGKLRLAGLAPPSGPGIVGGDGSTRNELYLWHYFGDPSMQMWGGDPVFVFDPSQFEAIFVKAVLDPGPDPPPYFVHVTVPQELNGQPISLLRNGEVIGKAIISNGQADIGADFGDGSPKPGELSIAFDGDGVKPVQAPVKLVDTSLSQTCAPSPHDFREPMTTSGQLSPGFAGAEIIVKYTPPVGASFERTVTTNANGAWSDTINLQQSQVGPWTIQARYAGDGGHNPSTATECTVTVNDPS